MTKKKCEAHQRSELWGNAPPCPRDARGRGLCNSHLVQLSRRRTREEALTPLLGLNGRKRKNGVQLLARVERTVANKVAALGKLLGAKASKARYRGTQALVEGYANGDLVWAPGKEPKSKAKS